MTLDELHTAVATRTGMTKAKAAEAVGAVLAAIQEGLAQAGEPKVAITGFGVFEVVARAERMGRNPQTGEPIRIAAGRAVRFKPGKNLREAVGG